MRTLSVLFVAVSAARAPADYHEAALAAHETTIAQVTPVRFGFSSAQVQDAFRTVYNGTCWVDRDVLHVQATKPGGESLQYDVRPTGTRFVAMALNTKTGKVQPHGCRFPAGRLGVEVTPWVEAMVLFSGPKTPTGYRPLRQLLGEYYGDFTAAPGGPTATSRSGRSRLTLSAAHGNLVRSFVTTMPQTGGNEHVKSTTVEEFQQIAPGVYFPKRCVSTESFNGQVRNSLTTTFTEVARQPAEPPPLRYFANTKFIDMIDGTEYTTGADGSPGPATPFVPTAVNTPGETPTAGPTPAEPARAGWWLAPAGLAAVAAGGAAWLYRRRTR